MNDKIYKTDYAIPEDLRVYAIGDIHGHALALDRMHEAISMDLLREPPRAAHIIYLGDYIDRGPDSKGVIDKLLQRLGRKDGIQRTFISGNHEYGMIAFLREPEGSLAQSWLAYGGISTLKSYGLHFEADVIIPSELQSAAERLRTVVPAEHINFLSGLAGAIELGGYFFTHAGVDPTKPLANQGTEELMFSREPFLSWPKPLAKMVVHGHTISKEPQVLAHRIGVDTGVYQKGGKLSAAVLEGNEVRFLQVEPT